MLDHLSQVDIGGCAGSVPCLTPGLTPGLGVVTQLGSQKSFLCLQGGLKWAQLDVAEEGLDLMASKMRETICHVTFGTRFLNSFPM